MRKITQSDIARELNVSRVTVTKALNNDLSIALHTRNRVRKKADDLGYIPNLIGRSLSSRKTWTLGLVLPKIAHSFFSQSLEFFYEASSKYNYNIIPTISFEKGENEERNIRTLLSMGVDGIIIGTSGKVVNPQIYDKISASGIKLIFYDRFPIGIKHPGVFCNDLEAARSAVNFIISKGYKKIVHFTGPQNINICKNRLDGYKAALSEAAIEYREEQVILGELTEESGYRSFIDYFITHGSPGAVFTVNDSVAIGIYRAAAKLKLKIPEDFAIVGFGDLERAKLLIPKLTTVHIPLKDMCCDAINMLVSSIDNGEDIPMEKIFKTRLMIRDSI